TSLSGTWGRLARYAAAVAGTMALAGCATGYAYVQPNAGSGGYYTSDDAYTGQGYYDYYGTGPYYPGTSGWGYYNGTSPYAGVFGWYGDGGYYGYGSPFVFNLGISNVWGFPGYWGPWYSLGFPIWGCWNGCWRHHHHGHWRHDRWHGHADPGRHDSMIAHLSPPHGLRPERLQVSPRWHRGSARPSPDFASRRPLESASFAPHADARMRIRRPIAIPRFNGVAGGRAWNPPMPESRAFAPSRIAPPPSPVAMPHDAPAPRTIFRAAPAARPPARTSRTPAVRIP
ncbi:MAG: hypothetical protein ACREPH_07210, partial [Rhodanobacteraceae bacterium]